MADEVKQERTHWRDLALNDLHRKWGYNCPMVDMDFIVIEYDTSEPKALIEYKHEWAQAASYQHPSFQALIKLGDKAQLPVFLVRYADNFTWWRVSPLNKKALEYLAETQNWAQSQYVNFLYKLRGRSPFLNSGPPSS